MAFCDTIKAINIWNMEEMKPYTTQFVDHKGKVYDMAWSSDDSKLVSCSADRSCIVWDIATRNVLHRFEIVDRDACYSTNFVDENVVVSGAMGTIYRFKL